jgi:hypothetical protein
MRVFWVASGEMVVPAVFPAGAALPSSSSSLLLITVPCALSSHPSLPGPQPPIPRSRVHCRSILSAHAPAPRFRVSGKMTSAGGVSG